PADVKCLSLLYLYVGRYPRNNASRNSEEYFSTVLVPLGVIQCVIFRTIAGMARSYHGNVIYIDRVGTGHARDSIRAPTGKITRWITIGCAIFFVVASCF
ncbi:MAG: hypothetical protein BECKG1743D_GA0114223_104141, partial [Candidatus Kentron sp. G]